MCEHGNVIQLYLPFCKRAAGAVGVDSCIAPLVLALNSSGFFTLASCCGHGNRPGSIVLQDGRELIIMPDIETARKIDHLFPNSLGEWRS